MKLVSLKKTSFAAITSVEKLGEPHALAMISLWICWWSDDSGVTLWLNLSFLPKVISLKL